ncbi:MAG TPA: hypothetical protein VIT22_03225, partial [Pseudoxanthomonas sp.]
MKVRQSPASKATPGGRVTFADQCWLSAVQAGGRKLMLVDTIRQGVARDAERARCPTDVPAVAAPRMQQCLALDPGSEVRADVAMESGCSPEAAKPLTRRSPMVGNAYVSSVLDHWAACLAFDHSADFASMNSQRCLAKYLH